MNQTQQLFTSLLSQRINLQRDKHLEGWKKSIIEKINKAAEGGYNYTTCQFPYWATPELEAFCTTKGLNWASMDTPHTYLISFDLEQSYKSSY